MYMSPLEFTLLSVMTEECYYVQKIPNIGDTFFLSYGLTCQNIKKTQV